MLEVGRFEAILEKALSWKSRPVQTGESWCDSNLGNFFERNNDR